MFGRKKVQIKEYDVRFYKEAALHGNHGQINVTSKHDSLQEQNVIFVFAGRGSVPKITPYIINEIFEQARAQGFIPHFIEHYGEPVYTEQSIAPANNIEATSAGLPAFLKDLPMATSTYPTDSISPAVTRTRIPSNVSSSNHA